MIYKEKALEALTLALYLCNEAKINLTIKGEEDKIEITITDKDARIFEVDTYIPEIIDNPWFRAFKISIDSKYNFRKK